MSEIVVKEVTEADYEDVINIRRNEDTFHGLDYLRDYFMVIYKTPGYKGYAAVVDGKIVAFEFAGVLDNGQTLFTRAGRASKQYSGKGVMKAINDYLLKTYPIKHPKLMYAASTFDDERYTNKVKEEVKDGLRQVVHEKAIYAYKASIVSINQLLKSKNLPDFVKAVSRKDMAQIFDSAHLCRHLFPDDRLVINWVAYKPMKLNIPCIYTERCLVYGSNINDVTAGHVVKPLLTSSNYYVLDSVILLCFDVYGSDSEALSDHLKAHLMCFQKIKLPFDFLQLELYCYDSVTKIHCDNVARTFGLEPFDIFRKRQYCTVTDINKKSFSKSNL